MIWRALKSEAGEVKYTEIPYRWRSSLDFEWDAEKDAANQEKHGISFEESVAVFADSDLVLVDASREEDEESRTKAIGRIEDRLFVVVFTERGSVIRIISARRTNKSEDDAYGDCEGKA